jgi:hypothetical protein
MTKAIYRYLAILFFLWLLAGKFCFAQEKRSTIYPYGGTRQSERYRELRTIRAALKFDKPANFVSAAFKDLANFRAANFDSIATFDLANFDDAADFWGSRFASCVTFSNTHFVGLAMFRHAKFDTLARFEAVNFLSPADFAYSIFSGEADFSGAMCHHPVDFSNARFDGLANFRDALFREKIDFNSAFFNNKIDFRGAKFDSGGVVDFSSAAIVDTVFIGIAGSNRWQSYNFRAAKLQPAFRSENFNDKADDAANKSVDYPGAKIILSGPVRLDIQFEKFRFIELCDTLNYFAKKDIISSLKNIDFKDNKRAQFELDYLLARSTRYQKVSANYEKYSLINPVLWWKFLYDRTMGMGYRPFRIIYLMAVIILGYTLFYMVKIPGRINAYISQTFGKGHRSESESGNEIKLGFKETLINCLYFSTLTFFTFRLNGQYLIFFNKREKNSVISEWLFGFLIYFAFLTLSKSGSILQNLKDLFIG